MTESTVLRHALLVAGVVLSASLAGCDCRGGPCGWECVRAVECVETCGGPVVQSGCCACPGGSFDSLLCGSDGGSDAAAPGSDAGDAAAPASDAGGGKGTDSAPAADSGAGSTGSLGAPCATAADCTSGDCELMPFDDVARCTGMCDAVGTSCPDGGVCWVPGNFAGWCVAPCDPAAPACPADLGCGLTGTAPGEYGCTS